MNPHELPRQPIELGDEISNTRFLTGRKAMIDITKPLWIRSGEKVLKIEDKGDYLSGIVQFADKNLLFYWFHNGCLNCGEDGDAYSLTHTPPASAASIPCQECERKQAQITHLEKEVSRLHVANRALSKMGTKRGTGR